MIRTAVLLGALLLACASLMAAAEPFELPLWPAVAPGSEGSRMEETFKDRDITDGTATARDRSLAGVTKPIITVFLPEQAKRTGVAVVVCPGGAFTHLAYDKEGLDVGRWLAGQGIAGVV
ncbi:MAG: alpha/beta hydrolase, partial [bacterium]|nr:alpha/beta hydrolase [bacterium]